MLHDDRCIGFNHTRKIGIVWNGFRILKIIKTHMSGPARRDRQAVGSNRIAIRIKDRNVHPHIEITHI